MLDNRLRKCFKICDLLRQKVSILETLLGFKLIANNTGFHLRYNLLLYHQYFLRYHLSYEFLKCLVTGILIMIGRD